MLRARDLRKLMHKSIPHNIPTTCTSDRPCMVNDKKIKLPHCQIETTHTHA